MAFIALMPVGVMFSPKQAQVFHDLCVLTLTVFFPRVPGIFVSVWLHDYCPYPKQQDTVSVLVSYFSTFSAKLVAKRVVDKLSQMEFPFYFQTFATFFKRVSVAN